MSWFGGAHHDFTSIFALLVAGFHKMDTGPFKNVLPIKGKSVGSIIGYGRSEVAPLSELLSPLRPIS